MDDNVVLETPWQSFDRLVHRHSYRLTRALLLRFLGLVYLAAFIGLTRQALPLLGSHGLTPAARFLERSHEDFWSLPTLFWIDCSDHTLVLSAWLGVALSVIVLAGYGNAPVMFLLWIVYGSFERVGQQWFSFGWEIQILETGFLAILLAPPLDPRPSRTRPPPYTAIVLYRWLIFRIMIGAGRIKWYGDACWRDLTCLDAHFETQPIPNPFSGLYHRAPEFVHQFGVFFNHVVELVCPWFVFGPRPMRLAAGVLMLAFQLTLISSGNLAFLNWLTVVPILACFDDHFLLRLLPHRARAWLQARTQRADAQAGTRAHLAHRIVGWCIAALVALYSWPVIDNLTSERQLMNHSYDRFDLVGTYGAFGSVGQFGLEETGIEEVAAGYAVAAPDRKELVIEGTSDAVPDDSADWKEYDLPCKPGTLDRRPCLLGPYHMRLDWLFWFAAMSPEWDQDRADWVVQVCWKLLHNDRGLLSLMGSNPFPDTPPRWIRVRRFTYRFADASSGDWWVRSDPELWMPPFSIDDRGDDPDLAEFLRRIEPRWPPIDQ